MFLPIDPDPNPSTGGADVTEGATVRACISFIPESPPAAGDIIYDVSLMADTAMGKGKPCD